VGLPGGRQPKLKIGQFGRAWGRLVGQGLGVESDLFGVSVLLVGSLGWVSWSGLVVVLEMLIIQGAP